MGDIWYMIVFIAAFVAIIILLLGVPLMFELYIEARCRGADEGRRRLGNEDELKRRYVIVQNGGSSTFVMIGMIYRLFFCDFWYRIGIGWWSSIGCVMPGYVHGREIKTKIRLHQRFLLHEYETALSQREQIRARIKKVHEEWAEAMRKIMDLSEKYSGVAVARDTYESVLEQGWNRLIEHPPNGFRTITIENNAMIFYFERRDDERERRHNRRGDNNLLAVSVNLETGQVSGLTNPWTPEVKITAIKYLAQGNLQALATMIARSVQ